MLPWLQEQIKRDKHSVEHLADCSKCMERLDVRTRQTLACGWEQAAQPSFAWRHIGYSGPTPTVCPGYSCGLPQVAEAARAFVHWERGTLRDRFSTDTLPEPFLDALEILQVESNAVQSWMWEQRRE